MLRRTLLAAVTAGMLAATMLAGSPGPASAGESDPPADCTLEIDGATASMTCTDRPADQEWNLFGWCLGWGYADDFVGNVVTGNGTSTDTCGTGKPQDYTVDFRSPPFTY